MSRVIDEAVNRLSAKVQGKPALPGVVKFMLTGEGTILMDAAGVRAEDGEADVTLTATPEDFRALLEGGLSPAKAFMTGKLKVDGAMGLAMKLGSVLG